MKMKEKGKIKVSSILIRIDIILFSLLPLCVCIGLMVAGLTSLWNVIEIIIGILLAIIKSVWYWLLMIAILIVASIFRGKEMQEEGVIK